MFRRTFLKLAAAALIHPAFNWMRPEPELKLFPWQQAVVEQLLRSPPEFRYWSAVVSRTFTEANTRTLLGLIVAK